MSRHPRFRDGVRFSAVAGRPRPARQTDPTELRRSLVHEGIVTAAALTACSDLGTAATSMARLGELTSGMWRALSRELLAAAERLDHQVEEHLDEVSRRAKALDVAPAAVLAVGAAAGHLAEHRETLETLVPNLEEEVQRLAAPDVLLGFSVDDEVLVEDDTLEDDDLASAGEDGLDEDGLDEDAAAESDGVGSALAIEVWLFLWPAPFNPARVRIMPELAESESDATPDVSSIGVGAVADDVLIDALSAMPGLSRDDILPALSALGMVCWSVHQANDHGDDGNADDDDMPEESDEAGVFAK
jgi:hypothetical protein